MCLHAWFCFGKPLILLRRRAVRMRCFCSQGRLAFGRAVAAVRDDFRVLVAWEVRLVFDLFCKVVMFGVL